MLVSEVEVTAWAGNPVPLENFVVVLETVFVHVEHVLVSPGTVVA